ncbi:MAG TPA: GspE/PulE family protein [Armatimonadota bacterium]|nr:GspE/PulE family protein [Armatimonadota bacterium]
MRDDPISTVTELNMHADDAALDLIPRREAMRLQILPMRVQGNLLVCAMVDPADLLKLDELRRLTGKDIRAARADLRVIDRGIQRFYGEREDLETGPALVEPGLVVEADARTGPMMGRGEDAPAVALVNELLETAILSRASDIHFEAGATKLQIRLRVDGVLFDHQSYAIDLHPAVLSRLKVMAGMDIGDHRLPQDGRFDARLRGKVFDIRASVVPSIFGEVAVLRLLPKTASGLRLVELGFSPNHLEHMQEHIINRPHGMIFATGPTGSGKTTTLYAILSSLDRVGRNVVTIEDPVEYQLSRATQIQVHPKIGLDFGSGLRSILRQDPDILMVGEIRDLETLRMGIQSALTGHLVLTTVHCNDAASGAARLVDMGAEPFLVASAATSFISQRLVRRICEQCRIEDHPKAEVLETLGIQDDGSTYYRGGGCDHCRGTGYYGRTAVFEIMMVSDVIASAITRRESSGEIRRLARSLGIENLRDDAINKAREGATTLEEIVRGVWVEEE